MKSVRAIATEAAKRRGITLEQLGDRNTCWTPVIRARHEVWDEMEREGYAVREIAQGFGVNRRTVEQAIETLRRRGRGPIVPRVGRIIRAEGERRTG